MMKYGEILKLIRDKRAYTLDYVANEIGISTDKLTQLENQPQAPETESLTKLADLYQVPVHSIEHLSIDHNINGNKDEQRRKELKDDIALGLYINKKYPLEKLSSDLKELKALRIKRENLKVSQSS